MYLLADDFFCCGWASQIKIILSRLTNAWRFIHKLHYRLDCYLYRGYRYPCFEQLGPRYFQYSLLYLFEVTTLRWKGCVTFGSYGKRKWNKGRVFNEFQFLYLFTCPVMLAYSSSLSKQVADAWKEHYWYQKQTQGHKNYARIPGLLFSIGKQSTSVRKWSGAFGLLICSRTTTLMTACCLMHGTSTPHSTAFREHSVIVYTSRALRSLFLSTQNGIEEKCK